MRVLSFLLLIVPLWGSAQIAEPLIFNEKIHDFGSVFEDGGNVTTEFTMLNNSGRPVKILNVQPSCGCTTPDWTREVIAGGKSGIIKASFDPHGKAGYFNKSITVTTDLGGSPIVLQIKGNVETGKVERDVSAFDVVNGALRTKVSTFNLGKLFINKDNPFKTFEIVNSGKSELIFKGVKSPDYIKIEFPDKLKVGESSSIRLFYDTRKKNTYGFMSDNIELITNDEILPVKSFSVFATIEEYFPPLTEKSINDVPVLALAVAEIKFGTITETTSIDREVVLWNKGKSELVIRAVQPNCTCITAVSETLLIKPGSSAKIKITFSPVGRPGVQNKSVTIYSNDPRNPVQRITLSGYVR